MGDLPALNVGFWPEAAPVMPIPRELYFADTDLRTSYVLGWDYSSDTLTVDLEVSLLKTHPEYQKPQRGHILDLQPGVLSFRSGVLA